MKEEWIHNKAVKAEVFWVYEHNKRAALLSDSRGRHQLAVASDGSSVVQPGVLKRKIFRFQCSRQILTELA